MMRSPRAGLAVFGGLVLPVTFETLGMRKHFNMNNALDINASKIPEYKYSDFFQTELSIVLAGFDLYSPNQRKRHELPRSAVASSGGSGQRPNLPRHPKTGSLPTPGQATKTLGKSGLGGYGIPGSNGSWRFIIYYGFMGFILWKGVQTIRKTGSWTQKMEMEGSHGDK
jgi:hypothetical protein